MPLLALIGFFIALGGVFILKKVTLLQIENLDHKTTLQIRVSPTEPFSLFYIHSIYLEPVMEEFRIREGSLFLEGVRTKSPGVMEYYGFEEVKAFHPILKRFSAIDLKRGAGEEQGLILKGKRIHFSEIAGMGERIRLKVISIPVGQFLYMALTHKIRISE